MTPTTYPIDPAALLNSFKADARVATNSLPYILNAHGFGMVPYKGGGWLLALGELLLKPRALTESGVNFGPSASKGVGRANTESNWEKGLQGITGFLIYDATNFDEGVRTWVLTLAQLDDLERRGIVGASRTCSRSEWLRWVMNA